ncbi:FecR family protein, partial [Bacteroides heparinolyticus]|uniref:FecR family protein n=1 Tax=Prevotella heparinolytica TaxID=28113 RepID=UPI0035A03EB5
GKTRTVYLVGEANFKVKKNSVQPFVVKSGTMAVTALGTEFNVFAYPESDKMIATLIHGKIKVDCDNGVESYILNPAQQVVYHSKMKQGRLLEADLEDVTAWQKGLVVFRGFTIKEILATLERRYAVTFQYNASAFNEDKYNFRFHEKSDIADIMAIIQEVVGGFTYEMEGDTCYIKNNRKKK